jgi:hypothetical protein
VTAFDPSIFSQPRDSNLRMLTCSVIDRTACDANSPSHAQSMSLDQRNDTQFHDFSLQNEDSSISPVRKGNPNLDKTDNTENTVNDSLHVKRDSKCILF